MARGEMSAANNRFITQPEAVAGVLDMAATPVYALDIDTDGNGLDENETWKEHQPDGYSSITGAALTGKSATMSGTNNPHYGLMKDRLDQIAGVAPGVKTVTTLADGRVLTRYVYPEAGSVDRQTFSAFVLDDTGATELLYGMIQQWSLECARGGDVGGNITMLFNKYLRNATPPSPNGTSEVLRITASGAEAAKTFTLPTTTLGVGGTITIDPGDTAAMVQTKVRALAGYNDAGVVVSGVGFPTSGTPAEATGSVEITLGGALGAKSQTDAAAIADGGDGWALFVMQQGAPPATIAMRGGSYIEANHALVYKAADFADLQGIDMGDATTPAPLSDPHLIRSAQAHAFSMEGLVNPVWFEDRQLFAASHVDGEQNITASITLPKDANGRCEEIYDSANEGGCGARPFYLRQAYRCGQRELWIDLYCIRNAQPAHPAENNVVQRQFPLKRHFNPDGSLIFTVIEPA